MGTTESSRIPAVRLLVVVELYLTLSLLGYLFGPIDLARLNTGRVVTMTLTYQAALAAGFLLASRGGIYRPSGMRTSGTQAWISSRSGLVTLLSVAVVSLVFSLASVAANAGGWGPGTIVSAIIRGFSEPGAAYTDNRLDLSDGDNLFTKLSTLLAPVTFAGNVVALRYWRLLPVMIRIVVVLDLVFQAFTSISRGQNFGVFKIVLMVAVIVLLNRSLQSVGTRRSSAPGLRWKRGALIALPVSGMGYFLIATTNRFSTSLPGDVGGVPIDYDNPLISIFPDALKLAVVLVYFYVCQGYYGLSRVFDIEHTSTWGLGTSRFLMEQGKTLTGVSIDERTYMYAMRDSWDENVNWHTAYAWIANDVGPFGTVVVMFLLGWFAARVLDRAASGDIAATVLLPLVALALLFLPMNTVVLSNPLTCMPLLFWTMIFLLASIRRAGGKRLWPPRVAWGRRAKAGAPR